MNLKLVILILQLIFLILQIIAVFFNPLYAAVFGMLNGVCCVLSNELHRTASVPLLVVGILCILVNLSIFMMN